MNPPFAYYGGKTSIAGQIVAAMPAHRVYIETHLGSGAVLFAKTPATHEIVNDLDDAIVTFFRVLRDRPDDLQRACALTPYARAEYSAADPDSEDLDDLERARQFWVRVNQGFAKTAARNTGWSVTTARTQSPANSTQGRVDRFLEVARRLARVQIEHRDAAELVDRMGSADAVVYADPPYLASTRVGRKGRAGDYRCDTADEAAHRALADVLRATPATVFLSGYPSPLYDELYGDWDCHDVHVRATSSNARRTSRSGRVERIWSNRPIAAQGTLGA